MKRILSFALVVALALSAASCGVAAPADEKEDISVSAAPAPEESAPETASSADISYTSDISAPQEESADASSCSEEAISAEESVPEESAPGEVSAEVSEEASEEISFPPAPEECTLRINEVMASSSVYFCPEGEPHDWIELYNSGTSPVDLSRYYITDNPSKYKNDPPLSGVLQPGGYAVVYACGEAKREEGYNCASFSLSKGETVYLVDLYGNISTCLTIPENLGKDRSYAYGGIKNAGAVPDKAQSEYCETYMCTPGFANGEAGLEEYLAHRDEARGALVIYELMTSNFEHYAQSGEYYDWVELKNVSGKTIDLSEYYLSDDENELKLWNLPSKKLEPGKIFTVFCSGSTKKTTSKYTHAPFKLSSEGERLFVTHVSGAVSDAAYIADLTYGGSFGRMDGKSGFFYFASPTPGAQNKDGCRFVAQSPVMSVEPGIYPEGSSFTVAIRGDGAVRYTLDGSEPNESSPVYTAPLTIDATTVIRASSFAFGKLQSGVSTAEYILCGGHTMPVVCISIDPDDMYSEERGIYYGEYDDRNANFHQDWERKVHFSLYDTNGETV
ncbi:MAG: lamin tail domain-containing protein, partial [Clostridia bacterium]|nr:lamin tail domain-containing protein [Clostridia bacterium]